MEQEQGLKKWEKHAKETYEQIIKSEPTKENAIMLASALTILGFEKLKDMEYRLTSKGNREYDRGYDREYNRGYDRRDYDREYDRRGY